MTKAELIDNVSRKVDGLTRAQVDVLVSTVFGCVRDALAVGDKVEIRGFGSFRLRDRAAREGRNPKTGEVVRVPAKKVPFFKAGKELKEMVDH
ncbi:MAG: HU family DNA-binding protein [Leptospirillia bacterium]